MKISGAGYKASAYYEIRFNGLNGLRRKTGTTSPTGTVSTTFTVPNVQNGLYQVFITDLLNRASQPFTVSSGSSCPGSPGGVPAAPSNLSMRNYGSYNFIIEFTDNASNETNYDVNNGNETRTWGALSGSGGYWQLRWTGVQPNGYMCVMVRARNSAGASAWVGWKCATTPAAGAPAAPTNAVATAISASQIRITWKDNSNNETDYQIFNGNQTRYRGTDVAGTGGTGSFVWSGLAPGTYMCFRVRAYNEWGTSGWAPSNTYTCTTPR